MYPFLIALAILPGLFICYYIFRLDKYETEPKIHLVICFLLGIGVIYPTIWLEECAIALGMENYGSLLTTMIYALVGVALIEESIKFVCLICYPFQGRFFNEPMDGIVYSVMIGMGFATLENIFYADRFGLETTLKRAFTAVPAHAAFAIIMGYFAGLAKFNRKNRFKLLALGLLLAIWVHGLYDFFLLQEMYDWLSGFAIVILFLAIKYSRKMVLLHQANSPFKETPKVYQEKEKF